MASKDQQIARAKQTRDLLDKASVAAPKGFKPLADPGVGDTVEFVNVGDPYKGVRGEIHRLGNEVSPGAIHVRLADETVEIDGKQVTRKHMIAGHNHYAARATMLRLVKRAPKKETAPKDAAPATA